MLGWRREGVGSALWPGALVARLSPFWDTQVSGGLPGASPYWRSQVRLEGGLGTVKVLQGGGCLGTFGDKKKTKEIITETGKN